jgi:DNA-binding response OmpR family regulator
MRILLVEDDPLIAQAVMQFMRHHGHSIDSAPGEKLAQRFLRQTPYDVLLLDWQLADGCGIALLGWLRAQPAPLQGVPVLMLTALDAVPMRVQGLEAGADDYLVKPFDLHELHARIQALGRRRTESCETRLSCGELEFELASRTLWQHGAVVELSLKELAVLELLLRHCGKTVTRESLHTLLYDWESDVSSNTLEVYISHLRKKLGNDSIQTLRGVGYRLRREGST